MVLIARSRIFAMGCSSLLCVDPEASMEECRGNHKALPTEVRIAGDPFIWPAAHRNEASRRRSAGWPGAHRAWRHPQRGAIRHADRSARPQWAETEWFSVHG